MDIGELLFYTIVSPMGWLFVVFAVSIIVGIIAIIIPVIHGLQNSNPSQKRIVIILTIAFAIAISLSVIINIQTLSTKDCIYNHSYQYCFGSK